MLLKHILPKIINAQFDLLLIQNIIKDDKPKAIVKISHSFRVKIIDIEWLHVTFFI